MQCVSVWEKKKIALKHSIIYVPAASVPQPLLLERGRERERGNTQGSKRQERTPVCWSTALLAFLRGERQRTTSLLLLHPCVCVCVWEAGGHSSSVSISRGSVLDLPKCSTTSLNAKRAMGDPTVRVSGLILQLGVCVQMMSKCAFLPVTGYGGSSSCCICVCVCVI